MCSTHILNRSFKLRYRACLDSGFPYLTACDSQKSADLLSQGKRLIVLQDAAQYSSYSDGPYATLDGHSIAGVFPKFLADAASCEPGTTYRRVAVPGDAHQHHAGRGLHGGRGSTERRPRCWPPSRRVRRDYASVAAGQRVSSDAGHDAAGHHE